MAGPRQIVDGPTFATLPYGLWDAVQKPAPAGPHWQNGITWVDRCSTGGTAYEECIAVTGTGGSPTGQASLASNVVQTNRGATSFAVYAEFDCSPVGLSDVEAVAASSLERVEQWQVERAFWTGTAGATTGGVPQTTVWPHLAANAVLSDPAGILLQSAATQVVTGASVDVADSLGQLEGALADCYHGVGVIHVPPEVLPTLAAWHLVHCDPDGALWTKAGNCIVVGAGYTGSSPAGVAASAPNAWIYATGAVFGYRSDISIQTPVESFDRAENTYRMIAERTYVLGWECCHLAAQVTLGVPT